MFKTYLFVALVAFALSFVFSILLIPILRKIKAGQNILSYVKEHKNKSGTPTMGGLAFVFAALFSTAIFIQKANKPLTVTLAVGVAYMAVGLMDDFLKRKHKENLGLKAWQKFLFQASIAALAGIFCLRNGLTFLYIPFTKLKWEIGFWIFPFASFVFLATVNAVNLTDGLDGLASSVSVPFFLTFGILIFLQGDTYGIASVCFALVGALLAYLLFNVSPASVFMGDTGSLALGGFASCAAVFTGNALYIAVVGIAFVLSVVSVILQVVYYKVTKGKRIFLMAPIHHHFQEKGYSESKISYAYFLTTLLLGVVCLIFAL